MSELFFILAFIWILTSVASIFLGPFVGLDRPKLRHELVEYWNSKSSSSLIQFFRRVALSFSWLGFLFPVVFPLPGLISALFIALLT